MKYRPKRSPRFERELRRAKKRGLNIDELEALIVKLCKDEPLELRRHDHPLH
ncbi:MAG: type II toxin-antitoxin system YafQ family toxin, partial [Synergistaceae bacterium]|nr:type II toxin-antitoxin system YafQ family toxin [Synergistaceae bacterium]